MDGKNFEDRLIEWRSFRESLTSKNDPVQAVIDFWNSVPEVTRNVDPYDETTWPTPWEMIEENKYCEFTKLLAIAYTLKLSNLFNDWQPIIKIGLDRRESRLYYMLYLNEQVIGYEREKSMHIDQIPKHIQIQKIHMLSELN